MLSDAQGLYAQQKSDPLERGKGIVENDRKMTIFGHFGPFWRHLGSTRKNFQMGQDETLIGSRLGTLLLSLTFRMF